MTKPTAEQRARDLLDRMEVDGAQSFSSGEVVELANLIARVDALEAELDELKRQKEDARFEYRTRE